MRLRLASGEKLSPEWRKRLVLAASDPSTTAYDGGNVDQEAYDSLGGISFRLHGFFALNMHQVLISWSSSINATPWCSSLGGNICTK